MHVEMNKKHTNIYKNRKLSLFKMLWTHIDYQMNHKLGILGHGQASRLDQERHRSVAWFVQFTPAERWELMLIGNIVIDSLFIYIYM